MRYSMGSDRRSGKKRHIYAIHMYIGISQYIRSLRFQLILNKNLKIPLLSNMCQIFINPYLTVYLKLNPYLPYFVMGNSPMHPISLGIEAFLRGVRCLIIELLSALNNIYSTYSSKLLISRAFLHIRTNISCIRIDVLHIRTDVSYMGTNICVIPINYVD